jgi:cytochrome c-type biogenesis protein
VLNLALNEATALRGMVLMFVFALGLGLPFVIAGLAYTKMAKTVGFVRRHQLAVLRIGGCFMVLVGLLLVTGVWDQLMAMLRQFAAGFTPVI